MSSEQRSPMGAGSVTLEEIEEQLKKLGIKLPEQVWNEFIAEHDLSHDGQSGSAAGDPAVVSGSRPRTSAGRQRRLFGSPEDPSHPLLPANAAAEVVRVPQVRSKPESSSTTRGPPDVGESGAAARARRHAPLPSRGLLAQEEERLRSYPLDNNGNDGAGDADDDDAPLRNYRYMDSRASLDLSDPDAETESADSSSVADDDEGYVEDESSDFSDHHAGRQGQQRTQRSSQAPSGYGGSRCNVLAPAAADASSRGSAVLRRLEQSLHLDKENHHYPSTLAVADKTRLSSPAAGAGASPAIVPRPQTPLIRRVALASVGLPGPQRAATTASRPKSAGRDVGIADVRTSPSVPLSSSRWSYRPRSALGPPGSTARRQDPVSRFQQMQSRWSQDRFLQDSSKNHKQLRWAVRTMMVQTQLSQPDAPGTVRRPKMRPHSSMKKNDYVEPTSKRRDELRWAVRSRMLLPTTDSPGDPRDRS